MSRLECPQPLHLNIQALTSNEAQQALSKLLYLVSACAGPNGKNHVIRNACGGHMTITSSSLRMLSAMLISRSELKVIISAILGHLKQYSDGGLFMAYMVIRLIKSSLSVNISHFTASSLLHKFVASINSYLASDHCEVVLNVDFSNVRVLLAYVRSILTSKTLLNLQPKDSDFLSRLVVETFVEAIPSVAHERYSDGIFVIGLESQPMNASKLMKGLLLSCPEMSNYGETEVFNFKTSKKTNKDGTTLVFIKAMLVTCSLSGDLEEMTQAVFEATEQQISNIDLAVFNKMKDLCIFLESENVGIVLCQKVIHPRLKTVLKSHGIFYLDRLGSQVIPYLRDMTGCVPVTSMILGRSHMQGCLGKLTSISRHKEQSRYLLLNNDSEATVVSLIIYGDWEERVSELKNCVNSCIHGLSLLAKEPKFLLGGGCWQMNCAVLLEKQILTDLPKIVEELSCSEMEVRHILIKFVSSLRGWCLQLKSEQEHLSFDVSSGHTWRRQKGLTYNTQSNAEMLHCCCGFKSVPGHYLNEMDIVIDGDSSSEQPIRHSKLGQCAKASVEDYVNLVLDSYTVAVQALSKAALTAGLFLSVGQCVTDVN